MGNRFDFDSAQKLVDTLIKTADTMEAESTKIQHNFSALGETFKDPAYFEYQSELQTADKTIKQIIDDIRELGRAINDYKTLLFESQ